MVKVGSDAFCGHWPVAEACCKLGRLAGLVGVILAFFGPFSNSQPLFFLYMRRSFKEVVGKYSSVLLVNRFSWFRSIAAHSI